MLTAYQIKPWIYQSNNSLTLKFPEPYDLDINFEWEDKKRTGITRKNSYKTNKDMKKQIIDLLVKMQIGENNLGKTANKLLDLYEE